MKVTIMANLSFGFGPISISGYDPLGSMFEGSVNSYFDKKSEKRAYERQLALMAEQYRYAQRYAENSPSWNVKGLRDAGLNPILAVSNGANLGSTVPSVPSVTSHKPTPSTSSGGFRYDPLTNSQLKVNDATIRNLDAQGQAALLKARADSSESVSRIAKLAEEVRGLEQNRKSQEKGGNYKSPIVSDIMKLSSDFLDKLYDLNAPLQDWATDPIHSYGESYLKTGPNDTKHSDYREKESNRVLDTQWKSRRTFDGKPVYRKRGDVGGIMHMYR